MIHLVPSEEEWERISYPDIHPNIVRKPAGRPKTKRIRKLDELRNPFKVTRVGGYVRSQRCMYCIYNLAQWYSCTLIQKRGGFGV